MIKMNLSCDDQLTLVILTLSSGLVRLNANDLNVAQFRHELMSCLIMLLRSGMNHEDLFVAIATTISSLGSKVNTYLELLAPYLKSTLESSDVSPMMVTVIADLFRVMGDESIPYLNDFCKAIFVLLAQNELDYKVRAECIATLNDMAISVGLKHFRPYLHATLKELQNASCMCTKNVRFLKIS